MLEFLSEFDAELARLFVEHGASIYFLLFAIAFLEATVTPFLPGDALIFAAGAVAATSAASFPLIWGLLIVATLLGTASSYEIGRRVGPTAFREDRRFLNAEQLAHVRILFDRFGPKILVVGRFVPVVRTFAPVVAGIIRMPYRPFFGYSALGIALWVTALTLAGYFVDRVPYLKAHFGLALAAVFVLSLGPMIVEWSWDRIGRPLFGRILPKILGDAYVYVRESGRMVIRGTGAATRQIIDVTRGRRQRD